MSEPAAAVPAKAAETAAPFPGLRPFARRDHRYFFGREDQTFALYRLLSSNHFVAVVGSSGSGKSSIVRAGLLPLLDEENAQSGRKVWQYAALRPGRDPINRLAIGLAKALGDKDEFFTARRDRIAAMLFASSHGLSEAFPHTVTDPDTQLVVLVDQFEELFRYLYAGVQTRHEMARRREEATNFIQLLLAATRSHDSRIRVIITMRSDFIGDCARFQGLPEAVSAAQFLVPSLSRDQREEAIRGPIELSGATISSELVERLLNDSSDELDQLPVLQHCLARLWMRAGMQKEAPLPAPADGPAEAAPAQRHLTEQDYKEIGGLAGAITGHANEIFSSLPGHEKTVEQVFRALAEIDGEGRAVRRAREFGQLVAETGASRDDVCVVLDKFRADECSFLVPPLSSSPSSGLGDQTVVDVGHEALLRRWDRVCGDPEATGERGDKRELGWLRQELQDGERYRFLHSCADPKSLNESRLSGDQARRYWDWWQTWRPNEAWAARYGGGYDDVKRLVEQSHSASGRARQLLYAGYAVVGLAAVLLIAGGAVFYRQQQTARQTFADVTKSAQRLSSAVLDSFNAGQTSLASATTFRDIAKELYDRFDDDLRESDEVARLKTSWLITSSDLNIALDDKRTARQNAADAEQTARAYLAKQPGDRSWLRLLYGSLFRIGDLDLEESAIRDGMGAIIGRNEEPIARALGKYGESQRIAEQLLDHDVAHPTDTVMVSEDQLAKQRFELAFAINKMGEALQVKKDYPGAVAKFNEALTYATMIEGATRPEWKLQSATTQIKIGRVQRDAGDIDAALQSYSGAIAREERLYKIDPSDKILRSNLASAHEDLATLYKLKNSYDLAAHEYDNAARIFAALSDDDPRDIKMLDNLARVYTKEGTILEEYAASQQQPLDRGLQAQPLDRAIEQYRNEVATRAKLVQRRPGDPVQQDRLRQSQERLQRVQALAAGSGKVATESK